MKIKIKILLWFSNIYILFCLTFAEDIKFKIFQYIVQKVKQKDKYSLLFGFKYYKNKYVIFLNSEKEIWKT